MREIVEEKAASAAQKKIREINSGFYVFDVKEMYSDNIGQAIDRQPTCRVLPDGYGGGAAQSATDLWWHGRRRTPNEVLGGNTRAELADIDQQMRLAKCRQLMADGVTIFYPATCVIDADVEIAPDTIIEPYVQLLGNTKIGERMPVRSYSRDSRHGDRRRT